MSKITQFLHWRRFYVAVPDVFILLVLLSLFWRPVAAVAFGALEWAYLRVSPPEWAGAVSLGIASNVISVFLIGAAALFFLQRRELTAACGDFDAFAIERGVREPWGRVSLVQQLLTPPLLAPRIRCVLRHGDVLLVGEGIMNRDQFLIGYYRETSKASRRRMGSFFMVLDGTGDAYEGYILFLDPDTEKPRRGRVRWERAAS